MNYIVSIKISVFWLLQSVRIQDPSSCVGFAVNGSTYIGITHTGPPFSPAANLSIFKLQKDLNVTLVSIKPIITLPSHFVHQFNTMALSCIIFT